MERLTKKDTKGICKADYTYSEFALADEYGLALLMNKLGQLEDIEELLGIDLTSIITLDMDDRFVISVNDPEYKKEIIINIGKNQIKELEHGKINKKIR